jgi:hypothetical protein
MTILKDSGEITLITMISSPKFENIGHINLIVSYVIEPLSIVF